MMDQATILFILAQILAVIAIGFYALAVHQKNQKKVLFFNLSSSTFYTLEYLCLKAFPAAGTCFIDVIQNLIYYKYSKKEKKIPLICLIIYIIIIIIIGIFTYKNIFSLIPIVLAILYANIIRIGNLKVYRLFCVFNITFWMIYNFSVAAYVGIIGNVFQLISAIIAIYRFKDIKIINKQKNIEVNKK